MVKQTQLANTNTGAFLFSNTKSCMNGGGYGVTNESLRQASENGLGRAANAIVKYSSCPQTGGNMADVHNNSMTNSYGYLKGDVESNTLFRGSYAPVGKHPVGQSCKSGGKKRRRKRRKSRKSRKSRRRRRKTNKRRTRYSKNKKRKTKKTRRRRRKRKVMKGGSSINYSIIDNSLKGENARILGSHSYTTSDNCGDAYNHYTGGKVKSLY